ncbi:hypothetical protein ACWOC1_05810 [Enterococcus quebecensis]|uniref:Uncharacterized protein n=1 Tax=Enterococcus quebecensis TaxID=903983 RepID=A0A1E5GV22_9ENTE|nr:hypothetical protein [Enterococcus quebecensis]OEG16477.1 hypothetical protein BCR23_06200 [Enterococcus quebecensis]OJG74152.1 hypothetical protein RV12_GL002790 [Enterococcus quebecensis]
MSASNEKVALLLSYLSETHTKSASLYDLVTSRSHSEDTRILLNINEVFTYYHSVRVFYFSNSELKAPQVQSFFKAFEDFYFELKQLFFLEDDDSALLYNKLTAMQDYFEQLTNDFNVL